MSAWDPKLVERLAARLPMGPEALERELSQLCAELGDVPTDSSAMARLRRRMRAANRHAALLAALPAPRVPAELDRRVLGSLHADVVAESADRLRSLPQGDAIAEGFAPVAAPADVDWAAAAVSDLTRREADLGDAVPTPGWLWSRIRSDLHGYRREHRRSARRQLFSRVALAAASLAVSGLLLHTLVDEIGTSTDPRGDALEIRFVRVDRPLAAGFSTSEIVRRVRDGGR